MLRNAWRNGLNPWRKNPKIISSPRKSWSPIESRSFSSLEFESDTHEHGSELKSQRYPPLMYKELLQYLKPLAGETFVDMTFGTGGHSVKILEEMSDVRIYALDRDPVAHEKAQELSQKYPNRLIPLLGKFSDLPNLFNDLKIRRNSIDGFLFDFGCSSTQLESDRGFSVTKNSFLDMRMSGTESLDPTVADVLERTEEEDLFKIIKCYGQEKQAKKIARAIIEAKYLFNSLKTTQQLAQLIDSVIHDDIRTDDESISMQRSAKTFQALRMFVNNELNEINYGMLVAQTYLKISGKVITISSTAVEDMIVKRHLSGNITDNQANATPMKYTNYGKVYQKMEVLSLTESPWMMLHSHVLTPRAAEIDENPQSISARFRALAKIK